METQQYNKYVHRRPNETNNKKNYNIKVIINKKY